MKMCVTGPISCCSIRRAGHSLAPSLDALVQPTQPFRGTGPVVRTGLRALGDVKGGNLAIEYRWHAGNFGRLPSLAAELVALNVAVIVTSAPQPTRAAKEATASIPIVFVTVANPVRPGFVESLPRPGGNITGFQSLAQGGFRGEAPGAVQGSSSSPTDEELLAVVRALPRDERGTSFAELYRGGRTLS